MDRFNDKEEKEPVAYSTCYGCGEIIWIGEYFLNVYNQPCHDDFDCLKQATDSQLMIAGDDDGYVR